MIGTIINTISIVIAGIIGILFGKYLKEESQTAIIKSCAISIIFIGISGAISGMVSINNQELIAGRSLFVVICITLGTIIGEILNIEGKFTSLASIIKEKTGHSKDKKFVKGFTTASFTVCIGAMAILGSIEEGLTGTYTILITKSIIDAVLVMILTCSLGKGCVYSAIPVFILEGLMTLVAKGLTSIITATAIANISLIGSIIIFCVGINLLFDRKISVSNLLPAIFLAAIF